MPVCSFVFLNKLKTCGDSPRPGGFREKSLGGSLEGRLPQSMRPGPPGPPLLGQEKTPN